MGTRHIRKTNAKVTDHRFRMTIMYPNKMRPTFCGAEPTDKDYSKKDAIHVITSFSALKPQWVEDICEECKKIALANYIGMER